MIKLEDHPTFKPISAKVVIVPDETTTQEKSLGGIVLPEANKSKPCTGYILAIGPGSQRTGETEAHMSELKVGMRVLFDRNQGFNFKLNSRKYLSTPIRNVLCEVDEDFSGVIVQQRVS